MATQTIREQLIHILERGWHNAKQVRNTGKYIVYESDRILGRRFYVGKKGSLRIGETVKGSISLNASRFIEKYSKVQEPPRV